MSDSFVQARFFVASVDLQPNDVAIVTLKAVCRGPENRTWSKYTPMGEFKMTVNNPAAITKFISRIGKETRIDISDRDPICDKCHEEILDKDDAVSNFNQTNGEAIFHHKEDCLG